MNLTGKEIAKKYIALFSLIGVISAFVTAIMAIYLWGEIQGHLLVYFSVMFIAAFVYFFVSLVVIVFIIEPILYFFGKFIYWIFKTLSE